MFELINDDALSALKNFVSGSVDCVVTSPPYWKVRNYEVEGQIGQEDRFEDYLRRLVEIFREVRRVLTDRGTCWVNMGDTRVGNTAAWIEKSGLSVKPKDLVGVPWRLAFALQDDGWYLRQDIIWHKSNPMPESVFDRCTTAHEYVFLLTKTPHYDFFWREISEPTSPNTHDRYARGRNLGNKYSNTAATRSRGAWIAGDWDTRRQRVPANWRQGSRKKAAAEAKQGQLPLDVRAKPAFSEAIAGRLPIRNKRSVWKISLRGTQEAHFATFPLELAETCILAGCPPAGKRCDCDQVISTPVGSGGEDPSAVVGRAGLARLGRENARVRDMTRAEQRDYAAQLRAHPARRWLEEAIGRQTFNHYERTDRGGARAIPPDTLDLLLFYGILRKARTGCECPTFPAGVVLDPFNGAGTTGLAAVKHGMRYMGVELKKEYIEITRRRALAAFPLNYTAAVQTSANREPAPKDLPHEPFSGATEAPSD